MALDVNCELVQGHEEKQNSKMLRQVFYVLGQYVVIASSWRNLGIGTKRLV
jgi:hypothetical protein